MTGYPMPFLGAPSHGLPLTGHPSMHMEGRSASSEIPREAPPPVSAPPAHLPGYAHPPGLCLIMPGHISALAAKARTVILTFTGRTADC